jgi:nitrilase
VTTIIRGIRINLAAAICWESYMPLLRQSLYSQNINLYLAPTADYRDAWLSLMRTVGIEGRCFVVSSNMCVPKDAPTETNGNSNGHVVRERRGSCLTEEGFEIALPKSPSRQRRRRKSVFDEDGNEIVLGCEDDGEAPPPPRPQVAAPKKVANTFDKANFLSPGGSAIVSPFGEVIAGPQWGDPDGMVFADVDFRDCIRGRLDLDTAGSYSRNDSFQFSVEGLNLDPLPY